MNNYYIVCKNHVFVPCSLGNFQRYKAFRLVIITKYCPAPRRFSKIFPLMIWIDVKCKFQNFFKKIGQHSLKASPQSAIFFTIYRHKICAPKNEKIRKNGLCGLLDWCDLTFALFTTEPSTNERLSFSVLCFALHFCFIEHWSDNPIPFFCDQYLFWF